MFDEFPLPFADYAVDAIQCHDFCWLLNEVFTAPQILKVMFDAENKLLWLQRDFGVFMVNLFDIQVALAAAGEEAQLRRGDRVAHARPREHALPARRLEVGFSRGCYAERGR